MAKDLEISQEAILDLEDIWDFIAKDSPRNADRFIDQLYQKCVDLAEYEGTGRTRDELLPGILSIPHKRYVIFFQRDDASLRVVRILHGARDLGIAFKE